MSTRETELKRRLDEAERKQLAADDYAAYLAAGYALAAFLYFDRTWWVFVLVLLGILAAMSFWLTHQVGKAWDDWMEYVNEDGDDE